MKIVIIIMAFVAVFLIVFGKYLWHGATVKLKSITYNNSNEVMSFIYEDGSKIEYKGSGTVWHRLPSFKRCGTSTESILCDYWEMVKYHKGEVNF